jgi:toxin ParE1/3/4
MTRVYRLSRQAESDLEEIARYIASDSPESAGRVLDALRAAFRDLADQPELGMLRDDLRPGLRLFVPGKPARRYLIFYYPTADGIEVSTVIHGARDWQSLFEAGQR